MKSMSRCLVFVLLSLAASTAFADVKLCGRGYISQMKVLPVSNDARVRFAVVLDTTGFDNAGIHLTPENGKGYRWITYVRPENNIDGWDDLRSTLQAAMLGRIAVDLAVEGGDSKPCEDILESQAIVRVCAAEQECNR